MEACIKEDAHEVNKKKNFTIYWLSEEEGQRRGGCVKIKSYVKNGFRRRVIC